MSTRECVRLAERVAHPVLRDKLLRRGQAEMDEKEGAAGLAVTNESG